MTRHCLHCAGAFIVIGERGRPKRYCTANCWRQAQRRKARRLFRIETKYGLSELADQYRPKREVKP